MNTVSILALLAVCLTIAMAAAPTIKVKSGSATPALNDTVELECVGGGGTPWKWFKDNATLSDAGIISGATTAVLKLTMITAADYGTYKCNAKDEDSPNLELEVPEKSGASGLSGLPVAVMILTFIASVFLRG